MKTIHNISGNIYHISPGNKKLKPNKTTMFIIWNLPAIMTCPYRTGLCEKSCYAVKAERQYKQVRPSRMDNFRAARSDTFVSDMISVLETVTRRTRKQKIYVRIHESGDFFNQAYSLAWLEIAQHFSGDNRFTFIAYTKSFRFFDGVELPENFSLRASIWADTKPEQIAIILKNKWPIYTAVESFSAADTFVQCRCSDCATCAKCWDKTIPDIRCEIH